ncbi:NCS cytosine-purine permease [Gymnopilus junonius]|uniref:NCS cytosine-purine permease n=1 Tax=Gymnopilus junonius TaxID=109634 RepID=A0A9P5NN13_GYMJU|nr:NCS cytosine-purine permease [Gymnopilus junonius]
MSVKNRDAIPAHGSEKLDTEVITVEVASSTNSSWMKRLATWGVEERGIVPVPLEERTDEQYSKLCFVWFSSNLTILTFSIGTLGPVVFQLGLRDSCLVILLFNLFCTIFPAYFSTWGAHLGMRQMTLSRYTFGYYGVIIPCILNLIGIIGFCTLNCILGGQALASVTNGHLSWTVGIVIFTVVSVLVSFFGYNFLHWFERLAWIPVLIAFIIAAAVGGKHLHNIPSHVPVTAPAILGFVGQQAGFMITWSGYSADYGAYLQPVGSSWKVFTYAYLGLFLPNVFVQSFGAAVAIAATSIPAWNDAFAGGNVGGLIEAIYQPLGNFGKFLTVIMSLSVSPNLVSIFYSASLNYQVIVPRLFVVPRYVFTLLTAAIVLPLSIVGAHRFDAAITNFLGLIGYWASAYVIVLIIEHVYFRSNKFSNYDLDVWNDPKRLPWGLGALGAGILSFALVIPCMSQVWFTGPIAKKTGDLGFEVALVLSGILYPPIRWLEIKLMGHL